MYCGSRRLRLLAVAALMAPLPIPAALADAGPAVSRINAKISAEGGNIDSDGAGIVTGALSAPLGHAFGFQADGEIGIVDGEEYGGGAFHLFRRDPSRFLFGAYGSYHQWKSIKISRLAGEFEIYRSQWTLGGLAGWEHVDVPTTVNGLAVTNRDDDHFFTEIDLAWYATDNFKLSAGYHYENEKSLFSGELEYSPGWQSAATVYANADIGEDSYARLTGGVRFYLNGGEQKSLIRRHREDDPQTYSPIFPDSLTTVSPAATGGTNFCPSGIFDLPSNEGCTCPSGTRLIRVGEFGNDARCISLDAS